MNETRPNVLVLGGDGMLGHMLVRILSDRFGVTCTIRRPWSDSHPLARFTAPERCIENVDVLNELALQTALERSCADVVLNAVGIVKQKPSANDHLLSIDTNARLPHVLAALSRGLGVRVVQISTDCVFSGARGRYSLNDNPDPVDLYGRTKLLGELDEAEGLTLRTSIVGRQLVGAHGLFEWILSQRGGNVRGFTRAVFSGVTTRTLARIIASVLETQPDLTGVWQVASEPITKHDLIRELDHRLDLRMIIEADPSYFCDRSLDGSAFVNRTGISPPTWTEMIDEFVDDQPSYAFRDDISR